MKKIIAILAALIAVCSLSGCGDESRENSKSISNSSSSVELESMNNESNELLEIFDLDDSSNIESSSTTSVTESILISKPEEFETSKSESKPSSASSQNILPQSSAVQSAAAPKSSSTSKSGSTSTLFPNYSKPEAAATYVLNTNTKKFHYKSCSEVKKIKPKNYSTISSRSAAISAGYSPCKRCNP